MLIWFLLLGCAAAQALKDLEGEPPNCSPRSAFYADADGDGSGAPGDVYVGCAAPDSYVADSGDCDDADPTTTACDSGTGDSGTTAGDTGTTAGDTGTTVGDTGTTAGDSGTTAGDSGTTAGDSGTTPGDSGAGDSGTTARDSGAQRG